MGGRDPGLCVAGSDPASPACSQHPVVCGGICILRSLPLHRQLTSPVWAHQASDVPENWGPLGSILCLCVPPSFGARVFAASYR